MGSSIWLEVSRGDYLPELLQCSCQKLKALVLKGFRPSCANTAPATAGLPAALRGDCCCSSNRRHRAASPAAPDLPLPRQTLHRTGFKALGAELAQSLSQT
jgi:hypothetical protein